MGRDEDYDERRDRERHAEYTRQLYEDWGRLDDAKRDDRIHAAAVEAVRAGDTNAVAGLFGLFSKRRQMRKSAETGASTQSLTAIASAKAKAREAAIDPALSEDYRKLMSLMWEVVAVERELDALGNPTQGLDYARGKGLKAQLDELKNQQRAICPPIMKWPPGSGNEG